MILWVLWCECTKPVCCGCCCCYWGASTISSSAAATACTVLPWHYVWHYVTCRRTMPQPPYNVACTLWRCTRWPLHTQTSLCLTTGKTLKKPLVFVADCLNVCDKSMWYMLSAQDLWRSREKSHWVPAYPSSYCTLSLRAYYSTTFCVPPMLYIVVVAGIEL